MPLAGLMRDYAKNSKTVHRDQQFSENRWQMIRYSDLFHTEKKLFWCLPETVEAVCDSALAITGRMTIMILWHLPSAAGLHYSSPMAVVHGRHQSLRTFSGVYGTVKQAGQFNIGISRLIFTMVKRRLIKGQAHYLHAAHRISPMVGMYLLSGVAGNRY